MKARWQQAEGWKLVYSSVQLEKGQELYGTNVCSISLTGHMFFTSLEWVECLKPTQNCKSPKSWSLMPLPHGYGRLVPETDPFRLKEDSSITLKL